MNERSIIKIQKIETFAMEVPGRSQVPPHGYSLVSDGDHYDFQGLRNEVKMRSMVNIKTEVRV